MIPMIKTEEDKPVEAYFLGEFDSVTRGEGYVSAIVESDQEDKIILCKEQWQYTKKQMEAMVEFQERFFDSEVTTEEVE